MIKKIDQQGFEKALQTIGKPVVVDFTTDWCPYCKRFMPIIEEIAVEYANEIEVYYINIDDNPDIAEKYDVMTVPTVIVFQNGEITDSAVNPITKETVLKLIFKGAAQ